jgi:hypothetical protein
MSGQPALSIFRSLNWRAIIIGFVVDFGASTLCGLVLGVAAGVLHVRGGGDPAELGNVLIASPLYLRIALAIGMFFVVVGGFITGKIARRAWLMNSIALGILSILHGLAYVGDLPAWYSLVGMGGSIPCAALGAWFSSVLFPAYEPAPPPLPPAS